MSKIIVVTECPRFADAGTHQRCDLVSDDTTWTFYIPWHLTQQAMPACGEVLGGHFRKLNAAEPVRRIGKGCARDHD